MNINKQQIKDVLTSKGFAVAAASVVSAAAGYYVAHERLKGEYERLMQEETEGLRLYFASVQDKPEPEELTEKYEDEIDETDIARAGVELLKTYEEKTTDYRSHYTLDKELEDDTEEELQEKPDPVQELNALNRIFEEEGMNGTVFDMEAELQIRDSNGPYIISFEEWLADDLNHDQITVTYYSEDDVLVDDREQPIQDIEGNVGSRWASNFGYGSKDPKIVYVRNEVRGLDYEIQLKDGSYADAILGIQHSSGRPGVRRFRGDDE